MELHELAFSTFATLPLRIFYCSITSVYDCVCVNMNVQVELGTSHVRCCFVVIIWFMI